MVATRELDTPRKARVRLSAPLHLPATMAPYRYGSGDPSFQVRGATVWRTFATPLGPCSAALGVSAEAVHASAWGPGADWVLERLPEIAGQHDDPSSFVPAHPVLADLHRRYRGLRIARTSIMLDSLVPAILSQKITGKEAFAAWRGLLRWYGEPAPGPAPAGMRVPPTARRLLELGDWDWHRIGVDHAHRQTIRRAAARAGSLQRLTAHSIEAAEAALCSIRGIGVWTAAEVLERVFGSADHPSFGDYHIPGIVGVALGDGPVDDEGMARLLAQYRPHRGRVVRLLELSGIRPVRRGPRRTVPDYRAI